MIYAVQDVHRKNMQGVLVPVHDVGPASRYGDVTFLLGPEAKPYDPEEVIIQLREKLKTFGKDDYILPIGNPLFIGWATAIANHYSDTVAMLYWNRKKKQYSIVDSDLTYLDVG